MTTDEKKKLWGDCTECGAENSVMPCHVERLHGEEKFYFRGALEEPFRGVAEVAEGGIGIACVECGHAYGVESEE